MKPKDYKTPIVINLKDANFLLNDPATEPKTSDLHGMKKSDAARIFMQRLKKIRAQTAVPHRN